MQLTERHRRYLSVLGPVAFLAVIITWMFSASGTQPVDSFTACSVAGYPITDTNPAMCESDNGAFAGPLQAPTPTPAVFNDEPLQILVDGDSAGDYPRDWRVISTQAGWTSFWASIHEWVPQPPLISVNFATSNVVAVSEGKQATPGYRMEVTSVESGTTGTTVSLTETTPVGCKEPATPTNPYYLVQTPVLTPPIKFLVDQSKHACS